MRRTIALIAAPTLTAAFWMLAPAAHAGVVDAQCAGSFTRTFTPAITTTAQTSTAASTDSLTTCLAGPTGTGHYSTTASLSCVNITVLPPVVEAIVWSDGTGSTIAWGQPTVVGQTVVLAGVVTAGTHAGDTATMVASGTSYLASVGLCLLGTPIAQTTGLVDSLVLSST